MPMPPQNGNFLRAMLLSLIYLLPALGILPYTQAHAETLGYVVKVDSDSVYFDLGESSGVKAGQGFSIFEPGEELIHPVTGKSLGSTEKEAARGTVSEVHPEYSTGKLTSVSLPVKPSQRVRLKEAAPPSTPAPAAPGSPESKAPSAKLGPLDFAAVDVNASDLDGEGADEILLADSHRLYLYRSESSGLKPMASLELSPVEQILSVETGDLDGNGRAEIYLTLYNPLFKSAKTLIKEWDKDSSSLKSLQELPWMVRSVTASSGKKTLLGQKLEDNLSRPLSKIYPIEWDGKSFAVSKKSLKVKRLKWLYGFALRDLDGDGAEDLLYITPNDALRVQFKKGYWQSEEDFGKTPNRILHQEQILKFIPRMAFLNKADGKARLFVSRNIPSFGLIADKAGRYGDSELLALDWDGGAFKTAWRMALDGYTANIAEGDLDGDGVPEIITAFIGSDGKTHLWTATP